MDQEGLNIRLLLVYFALNFSANEFIGLLEAEMRLFNWYLDGQSESAMGYLKACNELNGALAWHKNQTFLLSRAVCSFINCFVRLRGFF